MALEGRNLGDDQIGVHKKRNAIIRTVSNMIVADVVEEETAHPSKQRPIDSGSRSSKESPFVAPVMRDGGVRVVEVSKHHCNGTLGQIGGLGGYIGMLTDPEMTVSVKREKGNGVMVSGIREHKPCGVNVPMVCEL